MSIRTNPTQAVTMLLRRLASIEKDGHLDDLKSELEKIKDLFSIVKKNEEELLDTLALVYGYLRNFNIPKLLEEKEDICKRIRNSTQKLLPLSAPQSTVEAAESSGKRENMHPPLSSSQLWDLESFKVCYDTLDPLPKRCLVSLLVFPENVVVKKMHVIYWWIGVGLLENTKRLEEVEKQGEDIFNDLQIRKLIVPHGNDICPNVNKFKINHWFGRELLKYDHVYGIYSQIRASSQYEDVNHDCLALDQRQVKLSDDVGFKSKHWKAVFNIGASYLNFEPQWMAKMKNLEMLHLGRWQDSTSHHIEVESEEFLNELRNQKYLKFLSLRGVSRLSKLPPSIFQLESLENLDLKACHNLETIPNGIVSLKNLRYLNVSQCYLLDSFPKGIEKLTKLKVLKGFLIGSSIPSAISDLAQLKQLERLSICIGTGAMIYENKVESFRMLSKLKCLKISWGASSTRYNDILMMLPSSLEKLHLEGCPGEQIPNLLQFGSDSSEESIQSIPRHIREFSTLRMLYITGGKLKTLNNIKHMGCRLSLEILCVRYLKHLQLDLPNFLKFFPRLTMKK
ncbi:hypothetical protein VNO77_42988 [Canavalia gladiata]|uniref:Disease resistance RPP13-like protein 4 n=1 Tax=Canavalia gladiata TaxID=3824 RepID=A0AAN9PPM7_CANGL